MEIPTQETQSAELNPVPIESDGARSPAGGRVPQPVIEPRPGPGVGRRFGWRLGTAVLVAGIALVIWRGLSHRAGAHNAPLPEVPAASVSVARVTRQDLYNEVRYPAEFLPYLEVLLHAKVSGYVDQIKVDIGDRVEKGQRLATLEVPELEAEYHRAVATQKRALAEYTDAHTNYFRLLAVDKANPTLVTQQELDDAAAKDGTTEAALAAAKADVEKYQTLVGYTNITAPFRGVITRRYADPGSLIQAGTSSDTQSLPLVRLSDNYHLRMDFPVDVAYVKDIHLGDSVDVEVDSLNGKTFTGKISRTRAKVEDETRKMYTEVEVDNPNLELVPGMYSWVVLKVAKHPNTLTVPIEALPPGQSATVYVINRQNELEERPVTLGLETPAKYEVLKGLNEGDLVFVGRRSELKLGQKVDPKIEPPLVQN